MARDCLLSGLASAVEVHTARRLVGAGVATLDPVFAEMAVLAGHNVWGLEHLTTREKAILCLSADLCLHRIDAPLAVHVGMALDNGLTPRSIRELLRHLGPYVGYPVLGSAFRRLAELDLPVEDNPVPVRNAPLNRELARFTERIPAPGLAAFAEEQLAQRWSRPGLSVRERAIACLAVDILYQTLGESFQLHLRLARDAGADRNVLADVVQGMAEFGLVRAREAARVLFGDSDRAARLADQARPSADEDAALGLR